MKEKYTSNFLIGLLVGALVAAALWYWQKSTAADEGALALLDRLAAAERRQPDVARTAPVVESDDLQQVKGIGPVFDGRLRQAGIDSIAQLAALSVEQVAELLDIGTNRANNLLTEAAQIG